MTTSLLEMSVNIVTAHLAQNRMSAKEVPEFLQSIHSTLRTMDGQPAQAETSASAPATAPSAQTAAPTPSAPAQEVASSKAVEPPAAEEPEQPPEDQDNAEVPAQAEQPMSNKIAYVRDNDLSDPAFEGLDPWLAARISPRIAKKLDPNNEIHPSVYPDRLVCLEDGSEVTLLRAFIKNRFGLTQAEYMEKWNLPDDYPMAPPEYIENKRKLALKGGLGRTVRAHREKPKKAQKGQTGSAKAARDKTAATAKSRAKSVSNDDSVTSSKGSGSRRKLTLFQKNEQQPA